MPPESVERPVTARVPLRVVALLAEDEPTTNVLLTVVAPVIDTVAKFIVRRLPWLVTYPEIVKFPAFPDAGFTWMCDVPPPVAVRIPPLALVKDKYVSL